MIAVYADARHDKMDSPTQRSNAMTIQLKCPHNHDIEARSLLAVISYFHVTDDTNCYHMNGFSFTAERVLSIRAQSRGYDDDPETTAALLASGQVRARFFKELSKVKKGDVDTLKAWVTLATRLCSVGIEFEDDYVAHFGSTAITNAQAIDPESRLAQRSNAPHQARLRMRGLPKTVEIDEVEAASMALKYNQKQDAARLGNMVETVRGTMKNSAQFKRDNGINI